ncbi:MAG: hypothetical protein JNK37_07720 [Verrucomicrobiales bacterium]|nr:hypothetical protein [Verrucomicrobiales bacterium]
MNPLRSLPLVVLLSAVPVAFTAPPRPQLQIINGTDRQVEIHWLKSDTERVPNGTVDPHKDTLITTTIGHRFAIVDATGSETIIESRLLVQAHRVGGIPAFYSQRIEANGYPIVASAKVDPYALKEAAYLIDLMLAKRPDVREAMIASGSRLCIHAWNEFTTDLPEFTRLGEKPHPAFPGIDGKDYWDARARGLGGSATDPYCSCGEENLLAYPGDPYSTESILIHEFAHNIHLRGLNNVDPTFDDRLKAAYVAAMKRGLWKGKYAGVNHHEYFAEGVQSWFDNNRENDHDHNHVNTRAELVAYDVGLAALCREVFGDTELKYTKPQTRLNGHLAGYDPEKAPTFVWPERLVEAKAAIRRNAETRGQKANANANAKPVRETRAILGWQVHVHRDLLENEAATTEKALGLLEVQLGEITRVVPAAALGELRKVPLYFNPAYPGVGHRAEYHPGADWLKENGRDPSMVRGIEFTNTLHFEEEMDRMPNFALHELAHAYHHRVVPMGFANPDLRLAYESAKKSGGYEKVERRHGGSKPNTFERAYAMTNPQEYFAETTEALFSKNDFFPFTNEELSQHDPAMTKLLRQLWGVR